MEVLVTGKEYDQVGFPMAEWFEDKNDRKEVHCTAYITLGPSQELYFASDGGAIGGAMYRMRPWKNLVGFRLAKASELYNSNLEQRAQQELMRQHFFFRALFGSDAVVMLADVADDYGSVPMHLSYGTGTPVQFSALHSLLHRRFILQREEFVNRVCQGEYRLPPSVQASRVSTEHSLTYFKNMADEMLGRSSKRSFLSRLFGG